MVSERPDPARIAELIDGTLTPEERGAIMRQIATDPESYELFVTAAAANLDLQQGKRETGPGLWRNRLRVWVPLAVAAP